MGWEYGLTVNSMVLLGSSRECSVMTLLKEAREHIRSRLLNSIAATMGPRILGFATRCMQLWVHV